MDIKYVLCFRGWGKQTNKQLPFLLCLSEKKPETQRTEHEEKQHSKSVSNTLSTGQKDF